MENILELNDVVKQYHNHLAVNHVSFHIPKGTIFGLLGPNGAGKTSIIRIITSITRADSGQIFLNGEALNRSHIGQIGYMPEERGLYKKMKVGEQILYLAQLKGLSKKEAKNQLNYWFDRFNIQDWRTKNVEELSKGMQQKIQFISTVIHQPKLLILDEPFSGLDPINTNLIRDEIYNLKEQGTSILFSTHRMEQVEQICEHIVLINKGQNVLEGSMVDIKNQFKENIFDINYTGELPEDWGDYADNIIEITDAVLEVKFTEAQQSNAFLKFLINAGVTILGFQEILPTLNQIFIKVVKGQSDE